jgi:tRNA dimethylallyltransferase
LTLHDPTIAANLNPQDGQRIVRALEVFLATGQSITTLQGLAGPMIVDPTRARKIVVLPQRQILHDRINGRFETMLAGGAEEEVSDLLALDLSPEQPVMKAIGVSQIAAMLRVEITRAEVVERGAAATRQYAKRQMTWFRNQMDASWERIG